MMSNNKRRWLVFDTETTGLLLPSTAALADQPSIIELALIEVVGGKMRKEHSWLVNPGKPLSAEITRITKLTDDDLRGAPAFAAVLPELMEVFLGAWGLVAHNLPFDLGMLVNELRRCGKECAFPYPPKQLCTVAEFFGVKGRRMKLTELYQHSCGKPLEQTHRALDDTRALAEIVIKEGLCA